MAKINKMTPHQEARLPVFQEVMRKKALRLQWADDDTMRASVRSLYLHSGLKSPVVIVLDNPLECITARAILRNSDQFKNQLGGQLGGQLRDQLRGQLGGQLWGQLGGQLGGQLRDQLWGQLRGQLGGQLRDQLRDQLGGQLGQSTIFAGGSELSWASWLKYGQEVGVRYDNTDWLDAWINYAETCGPLYPYTWVAFVSRRPTKLSFNDDRVLHCENGPAMAFGSGFEIYAWNGTRLPKQWIMDRDNVDPSEVIAAKNVEQRAAGAACIGWSRMSEKLDRRIIDGDPDSDIGALVELSMPGLPEPGRFLMAKCPRNGTICEGVPSVSDIDGKPIETAIAAQSWRDCLPSDEYTHPTLRT